MNTILIYNKQNCYANLFKHKLESLKLKKAGDNLTVKFDTFCRGS